MADYIITNPALITSVDINVNHEIEFHTDYNGLLLDVDVAFIEVVSGTFKFCVGRSASTAGTASYTAAEKVGPLSFENGTKNINYVCTSAGTFRITF